VVPEILTLGKGKIKVEELRIVMDGLRKSRQPVNTDEFNLHGTAAGHLRWLSQPLMNCVISLNLLRLNESDGVDTVRNQKTCRAAACLHRDKVDNPCVTRPCVFSLKPPQERVHGHNGLTGLTILSSLFKFCFVQICFRSNGKKTANWLRGGLFRYNEKELVRNARIRIVRLGPMYETLTHPATERMSCF
jgi:hypothetical protein